MNINELVSFDYSAVRLGEIAYEKNTKMSSQIPEGDRDDCIICGRPVNRKTLATWVHLSWKTGGILHNDFANLSDADGSQGFFSVGSSCLKKIPAGFVFKKGSN